MSDEYSPNKRVTPIPEMEVCEICEDGIEYCTCENIKDEE